MQKSYLLSLLLILTFEIAYSQICGYYKSNDPEYFPTYLCIKGKSTPSFCFIEKMGDQHPDNMYLEKGTYIVKGDSIFFRINEVGFDSLKEENYVKKGIVKRKAIILLNERGERYLKLKRMKDFSREGLCEQYL